jgi:hypothetical protein
MTLRSSLLVSAVVYDPLRLAAGLGLAVLLLVVALWLVRTTDWRPPSEADTPELDRVSRDLDDAEA